MGSALHWAERAHALLKQQPNGDPTELLSVLAPLAGMAGTVADRDAAARWQEEVISTARTRLPAGNEDTGDHAAAADDCVRASVLLEVDFGPDAPELAALHHNLAGLV